MTADPSNFYRDVIMHDARFTSNLRCSAIELLEPVTRSAVAAIMRDAMVEYGIPMLVFETYRSQMRQTQLFNMGATRLRDVGVHSFGLACDIVKSVRGRPSWDGDFRFMAVLARKHGMVSGLNWGDPDVRSDFVDPCHLQRVALHMQPQLFAGSWYPETAYSPWSTGGTVA